MYNRFFGFKERPFKLVPNPEFLFLSRNHEEVLAHLNYAVGFGEGFVEITGEVGTGKTTLCRMFLENLDDKTEAAYIFNPKLDALQLLKAINDEFGILTSDTDSIKTLIDRLNAFLLDKKAQGRQVILLVDEAQNLSADVLEQLRLLSNLETTTSKLLQIILVGQPELGELLESEALRQLNQRITLSCHLTPLSQAETREYIRHRIHIASRKPESIFTAAACRTIHKSTGGVPRLINIACDRALLTAFTVGKHQITNCIVKRAIGELDGKRSRFRPRTAWRDRLIVGLLIALVVMVGGLVAAQVLRQRTESPTPVAVHRKIKHLPEVDQTVPPAEKAPTPVSTDPVFTPEKTLLTEAEASPEKPAPVIESLTMEAEVAPKAPDLAQILSAMDASASRYDALTTVLNLWGGHFYAETGQSAASADDAFFTFAAKQNGLEVLRVEGHFNVVRKLNLPAILTFSAWDGSGLRFLTVVALNNDEVKLAGSPAPFSIPVDRLDNDWRGVAYIFWKNYHNYQGIIGSDASGEEVLSLKSHLKAKGYPIDKMTPVYDSVTRSMIESIQARNGLQVDGIVGPQTMIVIYNRDQSLTMPRLTGLPDA